VDLYRPGSVAFQQVVFEATGLGEGPHTMAITHSGTRNPASNADWIVVDAIEAEGLVVPPPPPVLERFEESDPGLVFSSGWISGSNSSRSGGAAALSSVAGESLTVQFTGDAVRWIADVGGGRAIAQVTIDGTAYDPVDLYRPGSVAFQQVVFEATGLGEGPHTMAITHSGTRNPASNADWIVVDAIEAEGLISPP
jgi:hypothetical protein